MDIIKNEVDTEYIQKNESLIPQLNQKQPYNMNLTIQPYNMNISTGAPTPTLIGSPSNMIRYIQQNSITPKSVPKNSPVSTVRSLHNITSPNNTTKNSPLNKVRTIQNTPSKDFDLGLSEDSSNSKVKLDVKSKVKWNQRIENIINKICKDSEFYKKIHILVAQRASNIHMILMSIGIFFGPISGIMNTVETVMDPTRDPVIPIISAVLAFLSGVVLTIIKFASYDEISISNKMTSCNYKSLEMNIKRQLSLEREDRIDAIEYLNWVGNSYDELYANAPLVSISVYKKFKNHKEFEDICKRETSRDPFTERKGRNSWSRDLDSSLVTSNSILSIESYKDPSLDFKIKKRLNKLNIANNHSKYSDGRMNYELNRMTKN